MKGQARVSQWREPKAPKHLWSISVELYSTGIYGKLLIWRKFKCGIVVVVIDNIVVIFASLVPVLLFSCCCLALCFLSIELLNHGDLSLELGQLLQHAWKSVR